MSARASGPATRAPRGRAALAVLALVCVSAAFAQGEVPQAPLTATLFLEQPPARALYAPGSPVGLVLQVENAGAGPVITTEGFSRDDLRRFLVLTRPDGSSETPAAGVALHRHADNRVFSCDRRRGVRQLPGISVTPAERLAGSGEPEPYVREFVVEDLGALIPLGTGRYVVRARIPLIAFPRVITDCDNFVGPMADLASAEPTEVLSNGVEFVVTSFVSEGFGPPLVDDASCPALPCNTFTSRDRTVPVKIDLLDREEQPLRDARIGIALTQVSGTPPLQPTTLLGQFRSAGSGQYLYNLDLTGLATGLWRIDAVFEAEGVTLSVHFGFEE